MKALSIQQPWAWLIVAGYKPIENRTWYTGHRGRTMIHAGKRMDDEAFDLPMVREIIDHAKPELLKGGFIGSVDIIDCVREHPSPWFFGPYGFVMADPRPCLFQPARGYLGFFEVTS